MLNDSHTNIGEKSAEGKLALQSSFRTSMYPSITGIAPSQRKQLVKGRADISEKAIMECRIGCQI